MGDWLTLSPQAIRIIRRYGFVLLPILPLATPLIVQWLGAQFVPLDHVNCCQVEHPVPGGELPGAYMVRTYNWISMFVMMGLIALAGAVYGFVVILKRDRQSRDAALLLTAVLLAVLLYITKLRWGTFQTEALAGLFEPALATVPAAGGDLLNKLKLALSWIALLWGVPACILIAAASSCVSWPGPPSEATAKDAPRRAEQLRVILYIAAAILVTGVIATRFLVEMPLAFHEGAVPQTVMDYVEAVKLQLSSIFTLILVTGYLPPAYLLSLEPRRVPGEQPKAAPNAEPAKSRSPLAQGALFLPQFVRVFAMVAPLLANPFANLLQLLVGH